ncbi:MAG: hypothetical protein GEU81_04160 [Nitriliruptorales bacterium]|nr:hypothetical protein [Nitriliruptorales bacterium]
MCRRPGDLPELIAHGRAIKAAVESARELVHPEIPDLRDVYGVIFVDNTRAEDGGLYQRNVATSTTSNATGWQ